ncbi:hypothetical protein DRE_05230 [Drechslerella stenobrocha 248]|uniref:Major facilitator superfamily (MFS) profile domain-containing protein n=1 Tax=Drechslerella stenobrocha 248 TaxID=1043628 RepID=W7HR56_9PEZI|nr:hypothetical protein DRE_05230 [Drechslerella stenobrocha 248]
MKFFNNPITNPFYRDEKAPQNVEAPAIETIKSNEREERVLQPAGKDTVEICMEDKARNDPENGGIPSSPKNESADGDGSETQLGIQKMEAIATMWSKNELYAIYLWIWFGNAVLSLQNISSFSLFPYAYSDFNSHSLIPTSAVVGRIAGGVLRLLVCKVIDIWGRPEGLTVFVTIFIAGLVLFAATEGAAMYAAAYVLYQVGLNGITYIISVFVADTTSLRNRGLMYAFISSPYIITTFVSPKLAQAWLDHSTWRWGFGVFCIILPFIFLPFVAFLFVKQKAAFKAGLFTKVKSGRTFSQSLKHYAIEFDAIGMLILMVGFVLFLLPFSIAGSLPGSWARGDIIAMLTTGLALLAFFPFYEALWAPKSFIPWRLLGDRTIIGCCLTTISGFFSFFSWYLYITSFLQVVFNLDVTNAGLIANVYTVVSTLWGIPVGYLLRRTNRCKWLALLAVPFQIVGTGLMIYFRYSWQPLGYLVMCQVFIALSAGTLVVTPQVAALAVGTHGDIATILVLMNLASAVGGAMGSTVAGAIWQNTLPQKLAQGLPADLKEQVSHIVGSLTVQLSYPVGSPGRDAIVDAYGVAQQRMCIAATAIGAVTLIGVWMWRDIRLDRQQTKGTIL